MTSSSASPASHGQTLWFTPNHLHQPHLSPPPAPRLLRSAWIPPVHSTRGHPTAWTVQCRCGGRHACCAACTQYGIQAVSGHRALVPKARCRLASSQAHQLQAIPAAVSTRSAGHLFLVTSSSGIMLHTSCCISGGLLTGSTFMPRRCLIMLQHLIEILKEVTLAVGVRPYLWGPEFAWCALDNSKGAHGAWAACLGRRCGRGQRARGQCYRGAGRRRQRDAMHAPG